jgi:hypothetical protein
MLRGSRMRRPNGPKYGPELEGLFVHAKAQILRERRVLGIGLISMAVLAPLIPFFSGASWSSIAFIAILTIGPGIMGLLALLEAKRLEHDLRNVEVSNVGIQLPLPTSRIGGKSFVERGQIQRVDLHESPYLPYVEVLLRGDSQTRRLRLQKNLVFDWEGFVDALGALGMVSGKFPRDRRVIEQVAEIPNTYAVKTLRKILLALGLILGMVLGIVWLKEGTSLRGIAIAGFITLGTASFVTFESLSVALRFKVIEGQFHVKTLPKSYVFSLRNLRVFAGSQAVTIQPGDGRFYRFRFVDPEALPLLAAVGRTRDAAG